MQGTNDKKSPNFDEVEAKTAMSRAAREARFRKFESMSQLDSADKVTKEGELQKG